MTNPWDQSGYRCRLEWGRRGARVAAERGDILVVVDVLRFSSAAITGVAHGAIVYPCAWDDDPVAFAARVGAEVAVRRRQDVPEKGRYSLSPASFTAVEAGTRVVLASPNGATCSRFGWAVPLLLVGALVNAEAVASVAAQAAVRRDLSVTVLAAGERWRIPSEDGELRFAIEDYLGAGAIIASLPAALSRSPEAEICAGAFQQASNDLARLLAESGSGRELREAGYHQDVEHCAHLNAYDAVPFMHEERLERWPSSAGT